MKEENLISELEFPKEYPYQPPKIIFKTQIYHPNVNSSKIKKKLIKFTTW